MRLNVDHNGAVQNNPRALGLEPEDGKTVRDREMTWQARISQSWPRSLLNTVRRSGIEKRGLGLYVCRSKCS